MVVGSMGIAVYRWLFRGELNGRCSITACGASIVWMFSLQVLFIAVKLAGPLLRYSVRACNQEERSDIVLC